MEVPANVSRLFRTTATVGPSLYIAATFTWRGLRSWVLRKIGLGQDDDSDTTAIVQGQTAMAMAMFEQEGIFTECVKQLPERDPRERWDSGEARTSLDIARLIAAGIASSHYEQAAALRDQKAPLPAEVALRSQHAKTHGCVHATFIVDPSLSDELAIGAFQRGARHEAVLRLSNANGGIRPDRRGDGRGMSIKLLSADGSTLQDFVLVNFPVFFVDDVPEYRSFMEIIHGPSSGLRQILQFVRFFLPSRLRKGLIFVRLLFDKIADPFDTTYHSMSPFALGGLVVRYIVTPVQPSVDAVSDQKQPNYLRERMRQRLSGHAVTLDFSVQIRDRATPQDVEQPSRSWRRAADRIVHIARIEVPVQEFTTEDKFCTCEDMSFSPWHSLPEHRPLGSLNRSRLLAYLVSSRVRHRLNMVGSR